MNDRLSFIAALTFGLCVALLFCQDVDANRKNPDSANTPSELLFSQANEIVLLSHNGIWQGTDDDLELRLRRDGTVMIIDYSFASSKTTGEYKLNDDGSITILPAGKDPWTPMPFSLGNGKLVIWPETKEAFFAAARKAGTDEALLTETAYNESFNQWPLRQQ